MQTEEKLYTPEAIAKMFSVTPYTVRAWIRSGHLEAIKLPNKRWRITQTALNNFTKEK